MSSFGTGELLQRLPEVLGPDRDERSVQETLKHIRRRLKGEDKIWVYDISQKFLGAESASTFKSCAQYLYKVGGDLHGIHYWSYPDPGAERLRPFDTPINFDEAWKSEEYNS